jgi:hypothetical protein
MSYMNTQGEDVGILRQLKPGELETMRTSELFHRLWTRAVGQPGYVKRTWQEYDKIPSLAVLRSLRATARVQDGYASKEWDELECRHLARTSSNPGTTHTRPQIHTVT